MIRNEKGQSLVETALTIPLLLILIVGIIDIGRLAFTYSSLHFTAQETVRKGGLGDSYEEMAQFAKNHFSGGDGEQLNVAVSTSGSGVSGDYITVTLAYPFDLFIPLVEHLFPESLVIKADSTIRIE